jgi:protein O-mannosyl-transferase
VALGMALFLGCQLLTGTILPLELIYEHRNYFASFGLLLAVVPMLAVPRADVLARLRYLLLAVLLLSWAALTAFTAYAWGNPLRLAEELALRAPASPRAQYELGRTYIIYSHYDPASPFTAMAYAPLEQSAALPGSSILPEQALIFMNARMHLPLKDAWWASLIAKLKAESPGVQDESSLAALTQCARDRDCELPHDRMTEAFNAALSHPHPSARLFATYGDYTWNVLGNHELGERLTEQAVKATPSEPAYQISLIRMLAAQDRRPEASAALARLETLNIGGRLDGSLMELRALTARK